MIQQKREGNRRPQAGRWLAFGAGLVVGALVVWAGPELAYVDWRHVVAPLDQRVLRIREDAKGNGRFGAPRSGHRRHQGVDLESSMGTSVHAIRSGTVVQVGRHRGMGVFVELEHRHHLRSLYAHLQQVRVKVGERVRQGQAMGTVGKTGNARHPLITPHLHLEVHRAGSAIDPATLGLVLLEPANGRQHAHADNGQ